jgi:hypothetical protein
LSVHAVGVELDLVADLERFQHRGVLNSENHRHAVILHVEVLDGTVLERDLSCGFVDLLDLAVDGGGCEKAVLALSKSDAAMTAARNLLVFMVDPFSDCDRSAAT